MKGQWKVGKSAHQMPAKAQILTKFTLYAIIKEKKTVKCAQNSKNPKARSGMRLGGDGALLRRGIPKRNKKPISRCNKGLSPVTRNT